jgi:peptidoglycan hydrolase-like protein with peptidoglycan-binding domain
MTPRQAQVALACFVLLATGVTYNALYMQGDAAGSRKVASEAPGKPPEDRARRGQTAKPASPVADAGKRPAAKPGAKSEIVTGALPDEAGADTIRVIQRELVQRGLGPVAVDGVMRPATRAAILAYEYDNRLPLTGEATEPLLRSLLLGAPSTEVAGSREVRSTHAEDVIKQVQRLLAARGYRPGAIDGRLSAETVEAIRSFEQAQGLLPAKGRVSAEVYARLQDNPRLNKSAEAR